MRKRVRENPCEICGHYHRYEEGEVCGVCGHRMTASSEMAIHEASAFPSEILKDFLFLGSYHDASRSELLKAFGISHILNTVPACQNLYRTSFNYHCLQDDKDFQFDNAIKYLEQCEKEKGRVLIHCMSGKTRSPAIVIAYLMKSKGWRLSQSFQWVKERRPQVDVSSDYQQQLLEYEQKIFGSNDPAQVQAFLPSDSVPSFEVLFPKPSGNASPPTFNQPTMTSIFERADQNVRPDGSAFGAGRATEQKVTESNAFGVVSPVENETVMDSS